MSLHFLAWTASILFGLEGILSKLISKHSVPNPWLFNFFKMFFVMLFTVPISLFYGAGLPDSWGFILLSSIFFAVACVLITFAIYRMDISVLMPMFSFRTALAVIAGALFLNETLTAHQYFLILVIFIFGIFVSVDEHFSLKSFFSRNTIIALLCMISLVFFSMFFKKAALANGFWDTTLWVSVLCQLGLLLTVPWFKKEIFTTSLKHYAYIASAASIRVVGTLTSNAAFAINISITSAIVSLPLSMVIAFLFSVFAPELLEKHTLKVYAVRFTAAAVMILAAINL